MGAVNTILLATLNVAAWGVLVYAWRDHFKAEKSRRRNEDYYRRDLDLQDTLKKAAVATWARQAGKVRPSAVGTVLTREADNEQREHEESRHVVVQAGGQSLHPSIFKNGADSA